MIELKISTNIMLLKKEVKSNKDNIDYLVLSFATLEDGNTYNVICKNMEYTALEVFKQYKGMFTLNSSKYGLQLVLDKIENI